MFAIEKIIENALYAICYLKDTHSLGQDIFSKVFNDWQDPEYLENFFHINLKDLQNGYFGAIDIEEAIEITIEQAYKFQQTILNIAKGKHEKYQQLQEFFKPLHNRERSKYPPPDFQHSKAYGGRKSWLRIYAIRIEPNVFIITGGAIKLTQSMQERPHTNKELERLKQVKQFLREEGLFDKDSIEGFIEIEL